MTGCASFLIDVLNHDETETGRSVLVAVCFLETRESEYGADSDGNRGALVIEREILDKYIDPRDTVTMDSWQIARVLEDAEEAFRNREF